MQQGVDLVEIAAGLLYLPAAAYLFRLAARTGKLPERALGWAFVSLGTAYLLYEAPHPRREALGQPFYLLGRIAVAVGCIMAAVFARRVFRPTNSWAYALVWGSAALLATGILTGCLTGDVKGFDPARGLGRRAGWPYGEARAT